MKGLAPEAEDEALRRGIRKLRELLKDLVEFEKWANERLDMSRPRKKT
jgi:hypothetical protein